jgi:hypothetical protein
VAIAVACRLTIGQTRSKCRCARQRNKFIYNLPDGHTVAMDAETGWEVWMTKIADMSEGETTPSLPHSI